MTKKLNIWPLLKANHSSGRSLIFLSLGIGRIIRLLLNLRNYCLLKNPFALQHVAKTLQNTIQQWDCEFDFSILGFISFRRKRHVFIAGIEHGLCSWKINQHKADVNSSVFICASCCISKGAFLPFQPSKWRRIIFGLQTSAGHVLCAKAIELSGYDCMQNINWKWGSTGFFRNLTRKNQRIWEGKLRGNLK